MHLLAARETVGALDACPGAATQHLLVQQSTDTC
jgi:hypothetical protein